jgi:hypothetical protein
MALHFIVYQALNQGNGHTLQVPPDTKLKNAMTPSQPDSDRQALPGCTAGIWLSEQMVEELNSAQKELLQELPQFEAYFPAIFFSSSTRWHFLYFLPLPHQHASFLPTF